MVRYFLTFLIFVLSGCSSYGVTQLYLVDSADEWKNNIPIENKSSDGVHLGLGHKTRTLKGHEFHVYISNASELTIEIDPTKIHCYEVTPGSLKPKKQVTALDPEKMLSELKSQIDRYDNLALLDTPSMLIDTFSFSTTPEKRKEIQERRETMKKANARNQERKMLYSKMSEQLLRKQTIAAGTLVDGQFICPLGIKAGNNMMVSINLGSQEFSYEFKSENGKSLR